MKTYNVGILGATGAVGREMLNVLGERHFPIGELKLFASINSKGKEIEFMGKKYYVEVATPDSFKGLDLVLGATSNALAKEFAPSIVEAGAVFIDNSSAFRMLDDVPLVVPQINPEDIFKHKGIIANPNCSTIIALMGLNPLNKLSKIKYVYATTFQAVSGAGANGPIELMEENLLLSEEYKNGKMPINVEYDNKVFPHQIASNVIPQIGSDTGNLYTTEEMKMQNEGRKIMHNPNMSVNCTCVRVPVIRSHSISLTAVCEDKVDIKALKEQIKKEEGILLCDDLDNKEYPMPILTSDQDTVYVGRIRYDLVNEKGITMFVCGDQVRKGAATNAIEIALKLFDIR